MNRAIILLILLATGITVLGYPWLAVILLFGGALAVAAMPPSSPVPERKWPDVPVPEAGGYPGWDFWKGIMEGATENAMNAIRLGTGIQYAADALGDFWKKDLWDADVPLTWVMSPWGPILAHKKADLAALYQLMSEAYAVEARLKTAKDPKEVAELRKQLEEIRQKIKSIYEDGKTP